MYASLATEFKASLSTVSPSLYLLYGATDSDHVSHARLLYGRILTWTHARQGDRYGSTTQEWARCLDPTPPGARSPTRAIGEGEWEGQCGLAKDPPDDENSDTRSSRRRPARRPLWTAPGVDIEADPTAARAAPDDTCARSVSGEGADGECRHVKGGGGFNQDGIGERVCGKRAARRGCCPSWRSRSRQGRRFEEEAYAETAQGCERSQ